MLVYHLLLSGGHNCTTVQLYNVYTHIHKKIVQSTTRMSSSSIFGCQYSFFFLNFPIHGGLNFYRNTEISEYQIQSLQNNKTSLNTAYVEPWLMAIITRVSLCILLSSSQACQHWVGWQLGTENRQLLTENGFCFDSNKNPWKKNLNLNFYSKDNQIGRMTFINRNEMPVNNWNVQLRSPSR